MTVKIAGLEFTVTPKRVQIKGKIENTEIDINVFHAIFSGETTSVFVKVGELEFTAKI